MAPMRGKIVERSEFLAAARKGAGAADGMALRKAFAATMKAVDQDARTIDFVISTATVDRMKDTIAVEGWDYDAYLRSPVVLWAHNSAMPPIAKALSVSKGEGALLSTAQFMDRDLNAFADSIFRMYVGKFLSAVSVGFIPSKWCFSEDKDRGFGMDFLEQELVEYSCCPIPANPEALVAARAAGIDTEPLREWAVKLLDEGGQVLVPRQLLEETFRAAKTPRTTRRKYLARAEATEAPATPEPVQAPEVPAGNCGRGKDEACGMKDPQECSVHAEPGKTAAASRADGVVPSGNCGQPKDGACGMKDPQECSVHRAESIPPAGDCGRDKEEACGMKDPQECSIHHDASKAGRAGNGVAAPPEQARLARLAEAKALKAQLTT
jgi:hypothetical protein